MPNISITGEFTAFKIPDSIDSRYNAHYVDFDIYGTVNFTNNIGVKVGYRSLDVGYLDQVRHRHVQAEGDVLRGGRAVLSSAEYESEAQRLRGKGFRLDFVSFVTSCLRT